MKPRLIALAASVFLATAATATPNDLRSVAAMQYHQRVLLVFAPSLHDPRLGEERRVMGAMALEAATRDLILVQVGDSHVIGAHDNADKLRRHYKVPVPEFRAFLIGKDGNTALTSPKPIDGKTLIGAIDAMPMRQDEVRAAREGHPKPRD